MKSFTHRAQSWLNRLPVKDPIERQLAKLIQIILLGFITIVLIAAILNLVIASDVRWQGILTRFLIFLLIIGFPLAMLRRGHFRFSVLIIITLFLGLETIAVTRANLREIAETLLFFTLAILLAGLLVGRRALVLTYIFSACVTLLSAFWEQNPETRIDGIAVAGNFILLNGLMSLVLDQFGLTLRTALTAALEREGELQKEISVRQQVEEALRQSEERFGMAFRSSPTAITITRLQDGRILEVNDGWSELFGYTRAEALGRTSIELGITNAEIRQKIQDRLKSEGAIRNLDATVNIRTGESRAVLFSMERVEINGELCALTTLIDVTERKRAEAALRESEEQYRILFEDSPISLWLEDLSEVKQRLEELKENGIQDIPAYLKEYPDFVIECAKLVRILDVNSASLKVYHARQKSELLGTLADVLHILPLEQFEHELVQIANGRLIFEREEVGSTLTGQKIQVKMRWSVAPGYEDSFAKVIVSTIDITERKRAEEAIREKERLLSEAQRIGHVGSLRYDVVNDSFQFSDEMYRLFDISKDGFQHSSESLLGLIYSSDRPMVAQWMHEIRAGGQASDLEFRIFWKNSELRYIQCTGAVEFDDAGRAVRFIGTAQDVTERKLAEIQVRQQIERLSALRKIDQAISSSFDLDVTLDVLIMQVISQLQVDAAAVLLIEPDGLTLRYAAGRGFRTNAVESARLRVADCHAVREGHLIHIVRLESKPDPRLLTPLGASEGFVCYLGVPLTVKGTIKGVLEIFHRSPLYPYEEWLDFLNALAGQADIAIENAQLLENLQHSNTELLQAYDATIVGWSHAMDLRDKETEGHTQRVTKMTLELAKAMQIEESLLIHIRRGALLHDIGKIGIPDNILLKHENLSEAEWEIMRKHPQFAYEMLFSIPYLKPALNIPFSHHEKWDGSGYPQGLKGEEIPLEARIFAVVDVWDALLSDRPYREAWTKERAKAYIQDQAGFHFDPQVVDVFMKLIGNE